MGSTTICRSISPTGTVGSWRGRGEATASQTAWALLGLVAAGVALALLLVNLSRQGATVSAAGLLTIAGAGMFVGAVALFLLYATRRSAKE
mgnify:CR=1 FL=1